jgi:hypothetical protein
MIALYRPKNTLLNEFGWWQKYLTYFFVHARISSWEPII